MKDKTSSPWGPGLTGRIVVYFLVIAGLFQALVQIVIWCGWRKVVMDDGPLEWAQVSVLGLAVVGLLGLAFHGRERRGLYLTLGFFGTFAVVRELNYLEIHRTYLSNIVVKGPLVAVCLAAILLGYRRTLIQEARRLFQRPALMFFAAGGLMVVLWAQILGQEVMWKRIYPAPDLLAAKRVIEEGLELAGYFLILCGVVEEWIALRKAHRVGAAYPRVAKIVCAQISRAA